MRAGGVDQVVFRSGQDIARLGELDQKLWVALACPTRGLQVDGRTLDLIDADGDARVRPPELIAACLWACERLRNPDTLLAGGDTVALADLDENTAAGAQLAREARRMLDLLGKPAATAFTLADISGRSEWLAAMRFNGDGIVTPDTADDAAVRTTIERILDTQGGVPDRHDARPGIDRARADAFFEAAEAMHAWQTDAVLQDAASMPLGDRTQAASEALHAVRAKVDDFFARCRVAAYDIQAVTALNPSPENYDALSLSTLDLGAGAIAELPLAPVTPGRTLPLAGSSLNPAWTDALDAFVEAAVVPLLGPCESLSDAQWQAVQARLAPCDGWRARRPVGALSAWAAEAIDDALRSRDAVRALIDEDLAVEAHNTMLVDLEKLVRLQRDLVVLLNNFVSFRAFYQREGAIFQAGTLYLDGRSCELTVQVQDTARHAALAGLAKTCLAYCDCTRQGEKMSIVAAFTAGDVDFLFAGRNGVFYDRRGRDWDATVTKLIENPTSVAQAFFSPYKKFVRMIEEQVAKRAAASDASAQGSLQSLASTLAVPGKAGAAGTPAAKPVAMAPGGRIDVGTVAAIGVAMGSISAVMVGIFAKFIDLGQWIPVALLGIVIAISGPSMLIAWLKLRQRSLGPILDASGWAINGRMKVNVRLGGMLSQTARMPAGAERVGGNRYRDRHGKTCLGAVVVLVCALAVLAWRMDWLDGRLPPAWRHAPPASVASPLP
ncbi:hypothetical protein [Variovorax sp. PAMC 28711]|uniref:hypothetical protein n=1 Tax=Variovorax sp. PAMC 28711 TaxID=1795631 RepID=UPI00078C1DA5|nr:hypothetical protein [Variovorax sp. PAMC 28711]AMM26859.1 hypothetical protein AX767_17715 [Variovorax sp. PAMC 28711]